LQQRLAKLMQEPSTDAHDDPNRLRRVERTREEMLTQGAAVAASLGEAAPEIDAFLHTLGTRPIRRIVIAGCGDSLLIGAAVRPTFERLLAISTEPAQALDYALYGSALADPETLVIAITASGSTPAVMAALRGARARGAATLGIANAPGSAVLTEADGGIVVRASRVGWPTQSSTAAIAVLLAFAGQLAKVRGTASDAQLRILSDDLTTLPGLIDAVVSRSDALAADVADLLFRSRLVLFAGAGPFYATAGFGAAKIKELSPVHAMAMPLEEYHHYRSQKAGDPLFLVAPDGAGHERAVDAALVGKARGGTVIALVPEGETVIAATADRAFVLPLVAADLAPIVYTLPLHLFAYHFAKAKFAHELGHEPPPTTSID
jgi:glutamine---fructose-6-phosphate transaminase (isomerizing)